MHWCCMVGNTGQDPHSVPPMNGVNIDWAHGGAGGGQKDDGGISDRFSGSPDQPPYPALCHRHDHRLEGTLKITDLNGQSHSICTGPRNGSNPQLIAVGKTFAVIKLVSDPPHW